VCIGRLFIGNSSNSGLFCTCCRYRLTLATVTLGRFILWVVFVFGGVACFCFFFFVFFLFVLLFQMIGACQSFGGVFVVFVVVVLVVNSSSMSNVPNGIGTSSSSFPVLPVVVVRGDARFCFFFFLLVLLFEMTGTCRSFGCMCVVSVSVFSVGRIFVFVGGLAVGGVAVVILPCFCCFLLSRF